MMHYQRSHAAYAIPGDWRGPAWLARQRGVAEGGLPWEEAVAASPEPGLPAIAARSGIGHVEAIEADPPISRESGWGAWLGVVNGRGGHYIQAERLGDDLVSYTAVNDATAGICSETTCSDSLARM